jgi:Tfp pilus assembly protein PilZ
LTFTLPGSVEPLSVESEVRWIRPAPPPDRAGRAAGMGVRFVDLGPQSRDVIETFLRERETREREDADLKPPPPPANGRSRR